MKKALTITLLIALVLTLACTVVNASVKTDLEAYLKEALAEAAKKGYDTDDYEVMVDRYLPDDLTETQANNIKESVESIKSSLVTPAELKNDSALQQKLLSLANEAAKQVGYTVSANSKNGTVDLYEGTKLLVSASADNGKLVQTGSSNLVYVVLAGVAIIAIAGTVVVKKVRS